MTTSMPSLLYVQGGQVPPAVATLNSSCLKIKYIQPQQHIKMSSKAKEAFDHSRCRQDFRTVKGTLAPTRLSKNSGGLPLCSTPENCAINRSNNPMQLDLQNTFSSTVQMSSGKTPMATADSEGPFPCKKQRIQQQKTRTGILKTFATNLCNCLENLIRQAEKTPAHADPELSLMTGYSYFAPIPDETPVFKDLEVTGDIPTCMNGVYIRTGPNPQLSPSGGYCFFDGDGMLHSVRIKDGNASYCARYVRTSRFKQERAAQQPLFIKPFGELHGMSGLARIGLLALRTALGLIDLSEGWGSANTGLTFFNKQLLAMSEDDLPYIIRVKDDGNVETVKRYDFDGQLSGAMTSHPKVDPVTGELFSISSNFGSAPYLQYFVVSPGGIKGPDVPIRIKQPMIAHDFAVTENYAVLPDLDLVICLKNMVQGGPAIAFDKQKTARLGVLPRYATSDEQIQWFELSQSFCFHYWTAWEEGDEIVLTGSILVPADKFFTTQRLDLKYELTEIRLNRATGLASKRVLVPDLNLESGQINQKFYGRKCRYVYLAIMEPLPTWVKVAGVAKVDLQTAIENLERCSSSSSSSSGPVVAIRQFTDEDCLGSEPFFVPRTCDRDADEDDGYVVTYVHHQGTGLSELLIMDARSPTLETVASVKLPTRVPYGLHGIFVNEDSLAKQKL